MPRNRRSRCREIRTTGAQHGKVLVAGGYNTSYVANAELYDPGTDTWTPTPSMSQGRLHFTATWVSSFGKVLVAGSYGGSGGSSKTAELYDPEVGAAGTWTTTMGMSDGRSGHTATSLGNGKVLAAGGGSGLFPNIGASLPTAELYSIDVLGDPCAAPTDCYNGFCADGFCCDTPCNAGSCDTCSKAAGAVANGTCTALTGPVCDDGNACTQGETCQMGSCTGGSAVVCTAVGPCYDVGVCSPALGCSHPMRSDGAACNDGSACTQTDTCQAGVCTGSNPVVCPAPGSCHTPGACNPQTGTCTNPIKSDGTACTDSNACTQTDTCQAGVCMPTTPVLCPPPDQCHIAGTCDPASGVCTHPAKPDGTACDDGDACTQLDTCQLGLCIPGVPKVCTACDDCHLPGVCSPVSGLCNNPVKPDNAPCDDGNLCSKTDTCHAGVCTGSDPVGCPAPDDCHTAGACDPQTGVCSHPAQPDGTSCDDGSACTQGDRCMGGSCTPVASKVCVALDTCHVAGTCDPESGLCDNPAKVEGAPCEDGDACTEDDTCKESVCHGGPAVSCQAQDACHEAGVCDPATGCSNPIMPDETPCPGGQCGDGGCVPTGSPDAGDHGGTGGGTDGGTGGDGTPGSCGCQIPGEGSTQTPWLLLGLLAAARRRRGGEEGVKRAHFSL